MQHCTACRLEAGKGDCHGARLKSGERDDTVHLSKGPWDQAEDSRDGVPGQFPDCLPALEKNPLSAVEKADKKKPKTTGNFPVTGKELNPHSSDSRAILHVTTEPSSIESIRGLRNRLGANLRGHTRTEVRAT